MRELVAVLVVFCVYTFCGFTFEPPHDKTNKEDVRSEKTQISLGIRKTNTMTVRPAKIQIRMGIRPVWSESLLSTWKKLRSLATHWAHSEESDQTGWMPRLIWVFAGRTVILLVLSWCGSFYYTSSRCRFSWLKCMSTLLQNSVLISISATIFEYYQKCMAGRDRTHGHFIRILRWRGNYFRGSFHLCTRYTQVDLFGFY